MVRSKNERTYLGAAHARDLGDNAAQLLFVDDVLVVAARLDVPLAASRRASEEVLHGVQQSHDTACGSN